MERFIAKQNVELLSDRLRAERDPARIATIRDLLHEAKAKLAAMPGQAPSPKDDPDRPEPRSD